MDEVRHSTGSQTHVEIETMVGIKLLNGSQVGSQVAHEGKVIRMGDPNEVTVIAASKGMTFEAWDLERRGDSFVSSSWKRLT